MKFAVLCLIFTALLQWVSPSPEDSRSLSDHVDPWDVVIDYDFSQSRVALKSQLHVIDKALRLAQKDMKYFQEEKKPWEKADPGDDHLMGFNFKEWNRTYIRPPEGIGDKQTSQLMNQIMVPEFDITKIKLKPDKKNNQSVTFGVLMKPGLENKIIGYSSKRLYVQIHAPKYQGAADNELGRFLSKVLSISRKQLKIRQGAGQSIRKVRIPKSAIQEKVYIRKLLKEFSLETVTEKSHDA